MHIRLALIVAGALLILLPHFVLPLGFIKGSEGALITTVCSATYHWELYLGILALVGGVLSLVRKKALYLTALAGAAGVAQAFVLRPASYYLFTEPPFVTLAQTYSVRAHGGIRWVVLGLSAALLAASIYELAPRARRQFRRITHLHISSRAIRRARFRSLAIIIAFSLVVGVFFSNFLLMRSIGHTLTLSAQRLGADLIVVPEGKAKEAEEVLYHGGTGVFYMGPEVMERLAGVEGVAALAPHLYVMSTTYRIEDNTETLMVIAYDSEADFTVKPWINYALPGVRDPEGLVVGGAVMFYPGQKIPVLGVEFKVLATLDLTGLGYYDRAAFMHMDRARELISASAANATNAGNAKGTEAPGRKKKLVTSGWAENITPSSAKPGAISAVFVKVTDAVPVREVSGQIRGLGGMDVIDVKDSTLSIKRKLSSLSRMFQLPILMLMLAGISIVGVVFGMSVNERQREIGLIRAMGARRADVFRLVMTEALMLSAAGGVSGILLGLAMLAVFRNSIMAALELAYIWPPVGAMFSISALTALGALLVGLAAGLYPALRASNLEPYAAIRTGAS